MTLHHVGDSVRDRTVAGGFLYARVRRVKLAWAQVQLRCICIPINIKLDATVNKLCKYIDDTSFNSITVDVSAAATAFFGTTVRQVSLRQTVSNHR